MRFVKKFVNLGQQNYHFSLMDDKTVKIAIISDLHVMAPELLVNEGSAFEEYLTRDRKMLRESTEILRTLVDNILEEKPQLTLVTGDLTKDGERASHLLGACRPRQPRH